ncbi:MAG: hypothetical protein ACLT76_10080 [Clostridium fessum]
MAIKLSIPNTQATEVELEDEKYVIVKQNDILAVIE